jgi:lipopolysaccharide/colanic/teichoic acid biosynthesis glycosyltransferase
MSSALNADLENHRSAPAELLFLPKRTRCKRAIDIFLSGIGLALLAPVMAVLVIIIRLDSHGAALYGQQRVGCRGVPFTLWKFRSMYERSDQGYHLQAARDWFNGQPNGSRYKTEADPRVTRVGKYLRRTSLDELPQLFNVLKGEMSLVGPRPMMPYDRPRYESWHFEREVVRPGITGLWQVSGRDRLSAHEMMALDTRYVRELTLWLDLKILALTLPAVLADVVPARHRVKAAPEPVRQPDAQKISTEEV